MSDVELHTGPVVTREHLEKDHGARNIALLAPSLYAALHVRLHDQADEVLHGPGMADNDHAMAAGLVFGTMHADSVLVETYSIEHHLRADGHYLPYVTLTGRKSGQRYRVTVMPVGQ